MTYPRKYSVPLQETISKASRQQPDHSLDPVILAEKWNTVWNQIFNDEGVAKDELDAKVDSLIRKWTTLCNKD